MNAVLLLLPAVFVVGAATSRTDVAAYRIPNRWIAFGLCYAAVAYLAAWAFIWNGGPAGRAAAPFVWYFERWCVNFAVSLVFAFVLWRRGMWGGGDAKLFVCYAALTPLSVYPFAFFDYYFAAFFLLWCVFVPATLWFLLSLGARELARALRRPQRLARGLRDRVRRLRAAGALKSAAAAAGRLVVCIFFFSFFRNKVPQVLGPAVGNAPLVQGLVLLASLLLFRVIAQGRLRFAATTLALAAVFAVDRAARLQSLATLKASAFIIVAVVLAVTLAQKFFSYQFDDKDDERSFLAPWFFAGVLLVWVLRAWRTPGFFISP